MKKICVLLCMIFALNCYSQNTFLRAINHFRSHNQLEPTSYPTHNLDGVLIDRSYELEAIISMYKNTNDLYWLRLFVKHADKVINARDDKQVGYSPITNYLGNIEATWVSSVYTYGYKYASVYHSGMLTYPLAEFCYIISQNPVYFQNIFANNTGGIFYHTQSLFAIANDLKARIAETMAAHEDEWGNRTFPGGAIGGGYVYDCNAIAYYGFLKPAGLMAGGTIPLNMQAAIGKTFLYMFLAAPVTDPQKNYYKERTIRIANTLRYNMVSQTPGGSNHYEWRYWDVWDHPVSGNYTNACVMSFDPYFSYSGNNYEDWTHAIIDISFAYLCYKNAIPHSMTTSALCFDITDMNKLAATFKNIYYDPMKYYYEVNRGGAVGYSSYSFSYPDSLAGMGHWLMLSEFDPDIYQMVSEIYTKYALNRVLASWPGVLGMVYSHQFRGPLNPIDIGQGGASSAWAGVAIGDFNNDGVKDIASVRNSDGSIFLYKWAHNTTLNRQSLISTQTIPNGSASQWRGIAIGDLDGQPGDEVAAIRNFDNTIYIWKNTGSGSTINMTFWKSIYVGPATSWAGIAIGNFDNADNAKEIAVVSNSTGHTYIYDYNGTNFFLKSTIANGSASQWAGIAAGNVDNDSRDEIIQARNFDGDIYIYKLNASNTVVSVAHYDAPSNMDWFGITAGDYDMDGKADICVHARSDGDLYFYKYNGASIVSLHRVHFVGPVNGRYLENNYLASGNLTSNSGCCVKDEIINFRNADGWNYIYELNIGGTCTVLCEGGPRRESMVKTDSVYTGIPGTDIKIYPNPASDIVYIEMPHSLVEISYVMIYNSLGELVKSIDINPQYTGNTSFSINTDGLNNGIYYISVNKSIYQKIIISR